MRARLQQVTRCVIEFCCTGRQLDAAGETSKRQRRGQRQHRAVLRAEVFDTVGNPLPTSFDAGVDLRDVQIAARHADPRITMRYERARQNLDRHPTYILAAFMASGT
jgi:integrase/recombinase XerD